MTSKNSPRQLNTRLKAQLMSASEIERTLVRLVHEIIEKNDGAIDLGLIGIRSRGVFLAQRIGKMIERIEKTPVPTIFHLWRNPWYRSRTSASRSPAKKLCW